MPSLIGVLAAAGDMIVAVAAVVMAYFVTCRGLDLVAIVVAAAAATPAADGGRLAGLLSNARLKVETRHFFSGREDTACN